MRNREWETLLIGLLGDAMKMAPSLKDIMPRDDDEPFIIFGVKDGDDLIPLIKIEIVCTELEALEPEDEGEAA